MGESSEINVYHNKDIIDRLERLETWWKFLPDPAMYTDILRMYEEIKGLLGHYLMKDEDDTVSAVTTFKKMPIIPDATGENDDIVKYGFLHSYLDLNYLHKHQPETITAIYTFQWMPKIPDTRPRFDEDIVKEKYLNEVLINYVKNNEDQTLDNNFTFNGRIHYTHQPAADNEPALNIQVKELRNEKLTKTSTSELQIVEPVVQFNNNITFNDEVTFNRPIKNGKFIGNVPFYIDDTETGSDLLTQKIWETLRYKLNELPELTEPFNPIKNYQLVHKKYVDDQINEHVMPDDVARKNHNNIFTAKNVFYDDIEINSIVTIAYALHPTGQLREMGEYKSDYIFKTPLTYTDKTTGYAYSDFINEHYYNKHTLQKDSSNTQTVTSHVNFIGGLYVDDKKVESLTSDHVELLNTLKDMLTPNINQIKFKEVTVLADLLPSRYLFTTNSTNFAFSNSNVNQHYYDGYSASVLGGLYRVSNYYPEYEFLGVLQEIKDDPPYTYKDTVHLMTYSLPHSRSDEYTPPMFNKNVGMWISGVGCNGLWDNGRRQLNSLETILGYVKPERFGDKLDEILTIKPVFSKVTCDPYSTIYESGLLYSKGYLRFDNIVDENVKVSKYAVYSKGLTVHPQKTLAHSDFNAAFGYLEWLSEDRSIQYIGTSFDQLEDGIYFPPFVENEQKFNINGNDGYIYWKTSTLISDAIEKELVLDGSHSSGNYNFVHGLKDDEPENSNKSLLKIHKTLNDYNLKILKRTNHENWYPTKIVGFDSSITIDHSDGEVIKELTTSLEDKIGYHVATDNSTEIPTIMYSRSLLQSSYSEHHYCNDSNKVVLQDLINLGHYTSELSDPIIYTFDVLHNSFKSSDSLLKPTPYLPSNAFNGDITRYRANSYKPIYSTIKWYGYPASVYLQHDNSSFYGLYFHNGATETSSDDATTISTLYNYHALMPYATRIQYDISQNEYNFFVLPNPGNGNTPLIRASLYVSPTEEIGRESTIWLNARKIIVPYLPTDVSLLGDYDLVSGRIAKNLSNTTARVAGEVAILKETAAQIIKGAPTGSPLLGKFYLQNDTSNYPLLALYSNNYAPGTIRLGGIGQINVMASGAPPNSQAYIDFRIIDNALDVNNTAFLRLSPNRETGSTGEGYLHFYDNTNNLHVIASSNSTDAIMFENQTGVETDIPHPVLVKRGSSSKPTYRLELRNDAGTELAYIEFK